MATKTKTWASVYSALEDTFRKWDGGRFTITAQYQGRQATKVCYTQEERAVTLIFHRWIDGKHRPVQLTVRTHQRTLDNLEVIQKAVEHMRMAEVRGIRDPIVLLYRQLYPQTTTHAPPPPRSAPNVPAHYKTLGVLPDAPIEVVRAAHKALMLKHHPDKGGSTARAQAINAAMDAISRERG